MNRMFFCCPSLKSLDLSTFDTANVTDMSQMFFSCDSLTSLNVSGFNTSKVTKMDNMFNSCLQLPATYRPGCLKLQYRECNVDGQYVHELQKAQDS